MSNLSGRADVPAIPSDLCSMPREPISSARPAMSKNPPCPKNAGSLIDFGSHAASRSLGVRTEAAPDRAIDQPTSGPIFLYLWGTLGFGLRIADGLGQHLIQLSLGSLRFPLGRLPLCHRQYVGMTRGKLNPQGLR
jgi:hypothetical protein